MRNYISILWASIICTFFACNSPVTPKPKGYGQTNFPAKKYQSFNEQGYPYAFEYPVYAKISKEVNYFGASKTADNWININFPDFQGTLYVSYRSIAPGQLDTLIRDAYGFVNKHNTKAVSIQDSFFTTSNGVSGVFFHIGGDVATNYQFFLTDSTHHFFRGALYFDTTPNEDSLAPVNDFIFKDLTHLVNTFKWQ